jgi:hypothetical protein
LIIRKVVCFVEKYVVGYLNVWLGGYIDGAVDRYIKSKGHPRTGHEGPEGE